jgi:CheY-like chemotaxis protein
MHTHQAVGTFMKVLVAEDDAFIRDMAVAELEDAGFEVVQATTGGQALRLLQSDIAIDALLTDIRMPEANGWEVARAYRERFPDLPVLYVTGYAEQMQPVAGGVILSKPYTMTQIINLLDAMAEQGHGQARGSVASLDHSERT